MTFKKLRQAMLSVPYDEWIAIDEIPDIVSRNYPDIAERIGETEREILSYGDTASARSMLEAKDIISELAKKGAKAADDAIHSEGYKVIGTDIHYTPFGEVRIRYLMAPEKFPMCNVRDNMLN